jgi:peptide/nickel transport system permease protein
MGKFLLRRAAEAIPTLIGVAAVVFILVRVVPGDPIAMMISPGASDADIAALRALYGLDKSILEQFVIWAGHAVTGDFGTSISLRQDVMELILARLPATLELAGTATLLAVLLGVLLAVLGSYWKRKFPEFAIDAVNGFALAIPDFIWALAFILVFGVLFPAMPISGRIDPRLEFEFVTNFYFVEALVRGEFTVLGGLFLHGLMPAAALGLPLAAIITRVLKGSLDQAMVQDYVLLARVKGFGKLRIILAEALRNAAIPALTLTGVQFTFLVGGTVLIEKIFSYPGIGNLAIDAVINRDLPLIQGLIVTFAVLFIVVNLSIDLMYAALNPKLRHG